MRCLSALSPCSCWAGCRTIERVALLALCLTGCAWVRECEIRPELVDGITLADMTELPESGLGRYRLNVICPIPLDTVCGADAHQMRK